MPCLPNLGVPVVISSDRREWPAGAAPLLSSKTNLAAAAGNFATESYQAGLVRFILFDRENNPYQYASGKSEALWKVTGVSSIYIPMRSSRPNGYNDCQPKTRAMMWHLMHDACMHDVLTFMINHNHHLCLPARFLAAQVCLKRS